MGHSTSTLHVKILIKIFFLLSYSTTTLVYVYKFLDLKTQNWIKGSILKIGTFSFFEKFPIFNPFFDHEGPILGIDIYT